MSAASAKKRILAELWESFAVLVRSYAAANNLGRPAADHAKVEEEKSGRLTLQYRCKTLALGFDEESGTGDWTITELDGGLSHETAHGQFGILEDSQVALSGRAEKMNLEVAAESFTARVFDEE